MREIFSVYLQNSLQLSLIIMLMLFISPMLTHRYSAKCRYYLWTVVFVALLVPIRTSIKLTLPEFLQAAVPQGTTQAASPVTAANTPASLDWLQYAGALWILGSSVFLIWHLFSHLRFLSAVKRWSEDVKDVDILRIFNNTKAELHINKYIPIKSCACIKTPMVVGLLRPVVLLPQVTFSEDELPLILKHELVHIKRKDLWYKILMLSTLAIHWFNPVIHLAVRSVLNLCEISCDEEVLKGIGAKGRARYGESVIGTMRNSGAYKTALSTNFYSGTKSMKKRIYAMMDMANKRFSPVLFMAVVAVTMCGTTAFALSPTLPVVPESNEQQLNQTITADTEPSYIYSTQPNDMFTTTPFDTSKDDSERQNAVDNSLPPDVLIPIYEDTPVEPSQAPPYDPEIQDPEMYHLIPRIIADDEN
ncbi:M56 family metallopeptidase [Oscillibacter sp.]|uniref:M56 family metallopeptidase n=1 Tax=Oscillibacter sp. TaxID=1945593 RepID=UPI0028A249FC|nr:M56 family metallopeptidase [Oscillibacter sp.]